MATATDPVLKRRKEEEEDEEQQQDQHLLLDQRENKVNNENEEKERLDLILLQSPNWLNLSSDLSRSILDRISFSIPDLLSFSAVCNPWRSLAKSSPISPPPLLLSPITYDDDSPTRSSMSKLVPLTPDLDLRTFNSPISKRALNRNCCGCSFGHLIFASSSRSNVLIADLFSTAEYRLPQPPPGHYHISAGILTAPPSSSSSMLFLISYGHALCWRYFGGDPDDDDDKDSTDWLVVGLASSNLFESATVFDGKLHVVHYTGELFSLEFAPHVHWKRLPDAPHVKLVFFANKPYHTRLVECDGDLLMVCFMTTDEYEKNKMEVYKIDRGEGVWVGVDSIGDWCLFMDFIGKCPLVRRNPGRWGGKSNCIYYAGLAFGEWSLLPLDGTEFEYDFAFWACYEDRWPSPIWAYPSTLP